MNRTIQLYCYAFAATLLLLSGVSAQSATELSKNGQTYSHGPTNTSFTLPSGWIPLEPKNVGGIEALGLRQPNRTNQNDPGIEATIFWSPLNVTMEEAIRLERSLLSQLYGEDAVSEAQETKLGGESGVRMTVENGPSRNGKESGVVYLFELGSGDNRWKLKVRATVQKQVKDQSLKAVEELLKGLSL